MWCACGNDDGFGFMCDKTPQHEFVVRPLKKKNDLKSSRGRIYNEVQVHDRNFSHLAGYFSPGRFQSSVGCKPRETTPIIISEAN